MVRKIIATTFKAFVFYIFDNLTCKSCAFTFRDVKLKWLLDLVSLLAIALQKSLQWLEL